MFDYEAKIQHWINRLAFVLRAEAQQRLKQAGHDLAAEEWALLMVLWRDGPTGMTRLAAITLRDRTTVTRLVDRLIRKKLLLRKSSPHDRRQVLISVSAQGAAIEASVLRAMMPLIKDADQGIDAADLKTTLQVLIKMTQNLSPPDDPD